MSASGQPHSTPVEKERSRRGRRRWMIVLLALVLVVVAGTGWFRSVADKPVLYASDEDHFKYGSIGSDRVPKGLPAAVIKVLPAVFPEYLPEGAPHDYSAYGLLSEPGHAWPIGISERRQVIDLVAPNCAFCHVGTVRTSQEAQPTLYLGAPGHTIDLEGFFKFLFDVAEDPRFTADALMPYIEQASDLSPLDRYLVSKQAIPLLRQELHRQSRLLGYLFAESHPKMGPGRVDTFNPYKATHFMYDMAKLPDEELYGTADFPSIWQQGPRQGMKLHWDGNNSDVRQRNFSASMGAGTTPVTVDIASLQRLERWLWDLPVPQYPFPVNAELAAAGKLVYDQSCYSCHARNNFGPESQERSETTVGQVVPLEEIGTDPYRLWSFSRELNIQLSTMRTDHPDYHLKSSLMTNGYANMPLDGIWLRAPYLHNGSVPTLADLLEPAANRPREFYRGYDVYDQEKVGFMTNVPQEGWRKYFLFRTHDDAGNPIKGNSNAGHEYGTSLTPEQKRALLEYMKTL
jgi:hypothetical protein